MGGIDTNRPFSQRIEFTTVVGAEDLLREVVAARPETSDVQMRPGRVEATWDGPASGMWDLHLAHHVQFRHPDSTLVEELRLSLAFGVLSTIPENEIRFRVAVEKVEERAHHIERIQSALGWTNSVSDWQVNLTAAGSEWVVEFGGLHWNARHVKMERQAFSTPTTVATVLARLAKVEEESSLLDPFCGAGTILVAAHYAAPGALLRGTDHAAGPLELAAQNLRQVRQDTFDQTVKLSCVSADHLPYPNGDLPRVASNMPFGKRVGSHEDNVVLYPAFLRELARVLPTKGRAVLLTEDKRLFKDAVARVGGIKIVSERILRYGGATPSCFAVARSRR